MQKIFIVVLLSVLAFNSKAQEPELDDGVYVLDESNFDAFVNSHDNLLVEFYAPWW